MCAALCDLELGVCSSRTSISCTTYSNELILLDIYILCIYQYLNVTLGLSCFVSSTACRKFIDSLTAYWKFIIVILYIMTFSLHQGGVVMSSQITDTQSSIIHPLAHILDICALVFSSCALFTVYPNRIM